MGIITMERSDINLVPKSELVVAARPFARESDLTGLGGVQWIPKAKW